MPPELVVVVLVSVAIVETARVAAGFRRRVLLNRALHELRRPLQGISLSIEGASSDPRCAAACLEQARVALEDLDAAINRRPIAPRVTGTALGEVTRALEDRWRFAGVDVSSTEPGRLIEADSVRLGAALDNLVSNAVEHGTTPISVRALSAKGSVRFEVRDGGPASMPAEPRPQRDPRRHGHGLEAVGALVASHGGTLISPQPMPNGGTMAAISVPTAAAAPPPHPSLE